MKSTIPVLKILYPKVNFPRFCCFGWEDSGSNRK